MARRTVCYDDVLQRRFLLPDGTSRRIGMGDVDKFDSVIWRDPDDKDNPAEPQVKAEFPSVQSEMDEEYLVSKQRRKFESGKDRTLKAFECLVDVAFDLIDGNPVSKERRARLQKLRDRMMEARQYDPLAGRR